MSSVDSCTAVLKDRLDRDLARASRQRATVPNPRDLALMARPIPPDVLAKLEAISADRDRRGKQPELTEDQTKGMIEAFVKHVYGEHYEIVDEDEDE